MIRQHPNSHLVGDIEARSKLATPALVLEIDALEKNLKAAAHIVASTDKQLRPHFKAHKSLEIAKRQLDLGAVGISVATLSEAELVSQLNTEILMTSIISTQIQHQRLASLVASGHSLIAVVDNVDVACALAEEIGRAGSKLGVLIDIDMGRGRSGCASVQEAAELAANIQSNPVLKLRGLQVYAGQLSHMVSLAERSLQHDIFTNNVATFIEALADFLPENAIISGGSTGSFKLDLSGPLSELQCGSYALMDLEYLNVEAGWDEWPFSPAAFVSASILSAHWPGHAIADAGDKAFASKYGTSPIIAKGPLKGVALEPISDEHSKLVKHSGMMISTSDRLECIPPHCDPTINLYSAYHVVSGEQLQDIWPIGSGLY